MTLSLFNAPPPPNAVGVNQARFGLAFAFTHYGDAELPVVFKDAYHAIIDDMPLLPSSWVAENYPALWDLVRCYLRLRFPVTAREYQYKPHEIWWTL